MQPAGELERVARVWEPAVQADHAPYVKEVQVWGVNGGGVAPTPAKPSLYRLEISEAERARLYMRTSSM